MKQLSYTVRFLTPAFLGNAEQDGQWRTPPFKALLRQWWRVAYAAEKRFNVNVADMRREEGLLFGHAWLENDKDERENKVAARKSKILIRLNNRQGGGDAWAKGTQQGVGPLKTGLDTGYAWFGLINRGKGLPDRTGIKAGQPAESIRQLNLAFPDEQEKRMHEVMALIHAFGMLGSRSRGGWGALQLESVDGLPIQDMRHYARNLSDCLNDDWAMSLVTDKNGLCVWQSTKTFDSWEKSMDFIARERKTVRTALKNGTDLRPALGFASPGRMPSPLRWKVIASEPKKLQVRVFALPHRIPDEGGKKLSLQQLTQAWNKVSDTLDAASGLQRLK